MFISLFLPVLAPFLLPVVASLITAGGMKWIERRKSQAEDKGAEIENDSKSALFYQNLLDDATKRINQCLEIIDNLNGKVRERDKIIETQDAENRNLQKQLANLIGEVETLTGEIRKYKQLNGKVD